MANERNKHNEEPEQSTKEMDEKSEAQELEVKKSRVPVWLYVLYKIFRIVLVPALCIVALYIGLRLGYSTFGGQDPEDVLDPNTWRHLFDLIFKD